MNLSRLNSSQKCFKCDGDGKLYPLEGKKGTPIICHSCNGTTVMEASLFRCSHCKGEGKDHAFEWKTGVETDCVRCCGFGYRKKEFDVCIECDGDGLTYPLEGSRVVPMQCSKCNGKGSVLRISNKNSNIELTKIIHSESPQQTILQSFEQVQNNINMINVHPLDKINSNFSCDLCGKLKSTSDSINCNLCNFDDCEDCLLRASTEFYKGLEVHLPPLVPTLRKDLWQCRNCISKFLQNKTSWHCQIL